jgi:Collagen triple helix repeat (20 copies)
MKTMLLTGAFLLALSISGCTLSPTPAAQGPPGPQGQAGATGQTGQSGQQGDPGQSGQQGDAGRRGDTGHEGREGREGQDAPCPAGQHRHTNPDTGTIECIRD